MRTRVIGLGIATLAALTWVAAVLRGRVRVAALVGILVIVAGLGWATRSAAVRQDRMVAGGLAATAVGVVVFYEGALLGGTAPFAGLVFTVGLAVAAWGAWRKAPTLGTWGYGLAAVGSAIWAYADLQAPFWLPGDVLMLVGCALAAYDP